MAVASYAASDSSRGGLLREPIPARESSLLHPPGRFRENAIPLAFLVRQQLKRAPFSFKSPPPSPRTIYTPNSLSLSLSLSTFLSLYYKMGLRNIFCGLGRGQRKRKAESPIRSSSSSSLSSSSEEDMVRVFNKFDANKDGKISAEEIGAVLTGLGNPPASDAELRAMVAELDADGDGFISLGEFMALNTRGVCAEVAAEDMHRAFSVFDANGDGKISAEEVWQVMRSLGEEASLPQCRRMVRGVDRDGDGAVSLEEFTAMMMGSAGSFVLAAMG